MMYRRGNVFNIDRKILYVMLCIVIVSVLSLTIIYAALSITLNINGNAEVSSASWDIYLDNVKLNSQSSTTNVPTITDKTTASFSTTLNKPGDFYEFSIDVVNNGSIDAMLDSVTKTPELSDVQKKYLNYIVEYQNGDAITTKQLVLKKSYVKLRVRVEFRKDITALDLPTTSETLDLSFKVNYTQSDDSSENVSIDNNGKLVKIVSGDLETVGSEIAIGNEHFYLMKNDGSSVTMFAKYNLYVGNSYDGNEDNIVVPLENPTGIQDSRAVGAQFDSDWNTINFPYYGTTYFSSDLYWVLGGSVKDIYEIDFYKEGFMTDYYVYDNNSLQYQYIENYKIYLNSLGINILEARSIKINELVGFGCDYFENGFNCLSAPSWLYSTSYWTGSAEARGGKAIFDNGYLVTITGDLGDFLGCRPVIKVSLSEF